MKSIVIEENDIEIVCLFVVNVLEQMLGVVVLFAPCPLIILEKHKDIG